MRRSPDGLARPVAMRRLVALGGLLAVLVHAGMGSVFAGPAPETRAGEGSVEFQVRFAKQDARVLFSQEEVRLLPVTAGRSAWEWGISLSRYEGPDGLRTAIDPLFLTAEAGAQYLHGPLVEQFRIGPGWLEHSLEISGPEGSSPLRFEFTVSGGLTPKVSEDGRLVAFGDAAGVAVLKFSDLRGIDAEGRELEALWERVEPAEESGAVLRLVVQGADHLFPLRLQARLAMPGGEAASAGSPSPATASRLASDAVLIAAPSNDFCAGAEVIPGSGPFPVYSSTVDLTEATTGGDPAAPSCQPNVSSSVWFAFTPATGGDYSFSVCADAPTATTVEDTVLAIYSSTTACAGLAELAGGCDDDTCGPTGLQSSIGSVTLSGGTTYYVVAWSYGATAPAPGAGSLQLRVGALVPPGPAPANDRCEAAEPIPPAGPFPYTTSLTADISGATTAGDPPVPSCQPSVSRSIWYAFTPAESGRYSFSLCADGATGTTVDDTVLAVYASAVACSGFVELPAGCDDDSCVSEAAQSALSGIALTAGTRYDIVVWQYGNTAPAPGNRAVQMRVSRGASPPNDQCAAATNLFVDVPVAGSTVAALDDTRLPSGTGCFSGVGQTPSIAAGGDVAYRFVAPETGRYSFRAGGFDTAGNAVLYVASDCPAGAAPAQITGCLGAANRSAASPEEVSCVPLAAGQTAYVYVDENAATSGGAFTLEAIRCAPANEPDGTPASAGELVCGIEGSITPAGDADFHALGMPVSGSRVFAMVDGAAANSTDFDLRVTTGADTLEYDDFNNDLPFGSASPNVSATRLDGTTAYLRVSHYSPAAQAEPYRLYSSIRPPASRATAEVEPNDSLASAGAAANEYYAGVLSGTADVDLFSFSAAAGELLQIGLDLDPGRDNTAFNGSLALLDAVGATLLVVNDPSFAASNSAGTGSLTAATPYSPGEALVYRVRGTGTYYARVAWSSGTPGDYLLSIAHNCRVAPPADVEVMQSDTPDPMSPGGQVTYAIVVANRGAHPASVVTLRDALPAGAAFVSAQASQGICAGSGPVLCHLGDLAAGASAAVTVVVAAPAAPGRLTNTVRVSTAAIDPAAANDAAAETTTVGTADSDGDGVADPVDCAPADPAAWAVPGEAVGLAVAAGPSLLTWSAPAAPGGTSVRYDLLRSPSAAGFQSPICLLADTTATSVSDGEVPGSIFYYLVRSENVCGANLGTRSDGTPRTAGACP